MKKSFLFLLTICILTGQVNAQIGRLVNKVKKSVTNEVVDTPKKDSDSDSGESKQPEPACACDPAELILDLGGKTKLLYSELSIRIMNDGSMLIQDRIDSKYYIVKDGVTNGPYEESDQKVVAFFESQGDDKTKDPWLTMFKDYISKSGDKYLITFKGKSYGPYGQINSFAVTRSKDKFAAKVTQNIMISEADGKKMDEAIKKAKTEQEKMDLAMQFQQQMMKNVMDGGGPQNSLPKFITNIAGTTFDPGTDGGTINADMKYDDIVINRYNDIYDLKGNKLITIKPEHSSSVNTFINSTNTKYVIFTYGALTYSDGTTLSELFNLHLEKADGKIYLAYMYFSPKKNSIMQCKIPF